MTATGPPPGRRTWIADAISFCFPPACSLCGDPSPEHAGCCPRCASQVHGDGGPVCERCCAPVGPYLDTTSGCSRCREDRFAFQRVYALGRYAGHLRGVCLRAKRDRSGIAARRLGEFLAVRWSEAILDWRPDLLVPIPSHWSTRLTQAAAAPVAMAVALATTLRLPWDLHVLRKRRATPAQATLPPTRRRENLKLAFGLAPGVSLAGGRFLLVDDILTTGTTAHRAAEVLRQSGAAEVRVAVAARGLG